MPLIIPGLILLLTNGWFAGQQTVGWILVIVAIVLTVLQVGAMVAGFRWVNKRRTNPWTWRTDERRK